jgi:hypothetical protein
MKTFRQWLSEDVGPVVGSAENGLLYQAAGVNSKYVGKLTTKVKVPKSAECNYLGICPKNIKPNVNILPVEV